MTIVAMVLAVKDATIIKYTLLIIGMELFRTTSVFELKIQIKNMFRVWFLAKTNNLEFH
jgi:hypothetical protein